MSLLWLAALVGGILSADVPTWRGPGAMLVGVALLALPLRPMARMAVGAAAAAPLLMPALAPDRPGEGSAVVSCRQRVMAQVGFARLCSRGLQTG